jgi:hypothetical protein
VQGETQPRVPMADSCVVPSPLCPSVENAWHADISGLPVHPSSARYDEVAGGSIDHAIRVNWVGRLAVTAL